MDVSQFEASLVPPKNSASSSFATPSKPTTLKRQISPGSNELQSVPRCFDNASEYSRVWLPLALQEARATIHQTIERLKSSVDIDGGAPNIQALKCRVQKIQQLQTNDTTSYVRVELCFLDSKVNGGRRDLSNSLHTFGHYGQINVDSKQNPIRKKLIMLLSSTRRIRPSEKLRKMIKSNQNASSSSSSSNSSHLVNNYLSKCGKLGLCIVEDVRRGKRKDTNEWSITVRIEASQWQILYNHQLGGEDKYLYGWCIQTITTQLRELNAMHNVTKLDLFHSLKGISSNYDFTTLGPQLPDINPTILNTINLDRNFHIFLRSKFTDAQRNAIYQSATTKGITLIQGPPGTGKTYTLHALMNANNLHHRNVYHKSLLTHIWNNMKRMQQRGGVQPKNGHEWWNWLENIQMPKRPSILLVAPSNMAVDNLYKSIMEGGFKSFSAGGSTHKYHPDIIRIGKGGNDHTIEDVSKKVRKFMSISSKELNDKMIELNRAKFVIDNELNTHLNHLYVTTRQSDTLAGHIINTYNKRNDLNTEIKKYALLLQRNSNNNDKRISDDLERFIVSKAAIVATTLNSSGTLSRYSHQRSGTLSFDVCIVDEAAQATELETLIPLQYKCSSIVLCGDPKQLPATVMSQSSKKHLYGRSLFERLYESGHPVHFLDQQFRCHPDIYQFPSETFYDGKVKMGRRRDEYFKFYHHYIAYQPVVFFDLQNNSDGHGSRQTQSITTRSYSNYKEACFCAKLLKSLVTLSDQVREKGTTPPFGTNRFPRDPETAIGVITPYRDQVRVLKSAIRDEMNAYYNKSNKQQSTRTRYTLNEDYKIQTIDGFQGQERECIIFSTVRTDGVGFSQDVQRLCVALTRAKYSLMIVGNVKNLSKSRAWREFLTYLQSMNRIVPIHSSKMDPLSLGTVSENLFEMLQQNSGGGSGGGMHSMHSSSSSSSSSSVVYER